MTRPGNDQILLDVPAGGDLNGATDRLFLLDPNGPATPVIKTKADDATPSVNARLQAFFDAGGKTAILQGYAASGGLPTLANAIALLPGGAGQVCAPDLVTSTDHAILVNACWPHKVVLLNGPGGASDSSLATLAAADIAATDMRGAALFADTGSHKSLTGGSPVSVPSTLTVAGLIAANDRLYGHCNVAAGGKFGIAPPSMLGVADLRNGTRRTTLNTAQVNAFGTTQRYGLVNYGFRSLASLTTLPQWWSFAGSRLIMQWRQIVGLVAEEFDFENIDGDGLILGRYESALKAELQVLHRKGALYGKTPEEAYKSDATSANVNPLTDIQAGEIKATNSLKVSRFVEHTVTTTVNRDLADAL